MLTRWGIAIADEKGIQVSAPSLQGSDGKVTHMIQAVVEATPQGRGLYASEGFQVEIDHYTVQLSDEFKTKPTQSFTWMIRPAKTKS